MGLTVLHPIQGAPSGQQESLKVDIVAVHGLNGDPVNSWTNMKTGAYWLRDYLSADIEGARVMTYGYNADVAFGNTVADIMDFAKDLLNSLMDKRELEEESSRPIIFIAHSLGGIVVKQALTAAHVDARFQTIKERTIGIAFFGTPHRGSEKASYGKILASVATTVTHRPSSRLIGALQTNSDTLQRLNSDFRFQLIHYQILTFYETKAMSVFSKPASLTHIVGKYSALLEVSGEDQIMVDSNHREMCKFASREDDTYDKLVMRIRRILDGRTTAQLNPSNLVTFIKSSNEYYEVPYDVSSVFTGRKNILQNLHDAFVPRHEQVSERVQKRYVIYGLGGSGKTQICLKFAQDCREKFWGIFFIDASSTSAVEQGFLNISRKLAVEQGIEGIKRWFSNTNRTWLLIFDNADDPQLDIARYFPTGDRGAILITSRNPECRVHATTGSSKLDQMALDEAITLLLRASFVNDPEDETCRSSAKHVVETLGCLALAIVHAGATIRQRVCTLDSYCTEYYHHRKQLLDRRPVQAGTDYEYTVYSTWEVSIEKITCLSNETARYAIELLNFFSVLHFENITEKILEKAWRKSQKYNLSAWEESHILPFLNQLCSENWNAQPFREAVGLLSSYSLIHIDGTENQISLHPLVHTWIRDRLPLADRSRCYLTSIVTLSRSLGMDTEDAYVVQAQKHIDSCLDLCQCELWLEDNRSQERILVVSRFATAYAVSGRWKQSKDLLETALEYIKKTMNEEYIYSLDCTRLLGKIYFSLGEGQKGMDLLEKAFTGAKNTFGPEDSYTLLFKHDLLYYRFLGSRTPESLEFVENFRILQEYHPHIENAIIYAHVLSQSGNHPKAMTVLEDTIKVMETNEGTEHYASIRGRLALVRVYQKLYRWQQAADLAQQTLEYSISVYGTNNRENLDLRVYLARSYENLKRPQDGIRVLTEVIKTALDTYGHEDTMTVEWVDELKEMQARYDQSLADKAAETSVSSRWMLKKMAPKPRLEFQIAQGSNETAGSLETLTKSCCGRGYSKGGFYFQSSKTNSVGSPSGTRRFLGGMQWQMALWSRNRPGLVMTAISNPRTSLIPIQYLSCRTIGFLLVDSFLMAEFKFGNWIRKIGFSMVHIGYKGFSAPEPNSLAREAAFYAVELPIIAKSILYQRRKADGNKSLG